jgi:hypothetical protein
MHEIRLSETLKKSGASASSVGSGGRGPGGKRNRRGRPTLNRHRPYPWQQLRLIP